MNELIELICDEVCYTAYSGDAIQSNLTSNIDNFIAERTDLKALAKYKGIHTHLTIEKFYCNSVTPKWIRSLVAELFTKHPVILTLWRGENAFAKINSIKGNAHPKFAKKDSVRGKFLCDNSICNLIHTPDSTEEAIRELNCLEGRITSIASKEWQCQSNVSPYNPSAVSHSGILTLYLLLLRIESYHNPELSIHYSDPCMKDSVSFYYEMKSRVEEIVKSGNKLTKEIYSTYFEANYEKMSVLLNREAFPLSEWEKFVLLCGVSCVSIWNIGDTSNQ